MFAGLGSGVLLVTVAVFEVAPIELLPVCATTVIVALVPEFMVARLHVTGPVPEHVPLVVIEETKVMFAGTVSVTVTPMAPVGPRLLTVIV